MDGFEAIFDLDGPDGVVDVEDVGGALEMVGAVPRVGL